MGENICIIYAEKKVPATLKKLNMALRRKQ